MARLEIAAGRRLWLESSGPVEDAIIIYMLFSLTADFVRLTNYYIIICVSMCLPLKLQPMAV